MRAGQRREMAVCLSKHPSQILYAALVQRKARSSSAKSQSPADQPHLGVGGIELAPRALAALCHSFAHALTESARDARDKPIPSSWRKTSPKYRFRISCFIYASFPNFLVNSPKSLLIAGIEN